MSKFRLDEIRSWNFRYVDRQREYLYRYHAKKLLLSAGTVHVRVKMGCWDNNGFTSTCSGL
jgi:hypothetical protein